MDDVLSLLKKCQYHCSDAGIFCIIYIKKCKILDKKKILILKLFTVFKKKLKMKYNIKNYKGGDDV